MFENNEQTLTSVATFFFFFYGLCRTVCVEKVRIGQTELVVLQFTNNTRSGHGIAEYSNILEITKDEVGGFLGKPVIWEAGSSQGIPEASQGGQRCV